MFQSSPARCGRSRADDGAEILKGASVVHSHGMPSVLADFTAEFAVEADRIDSPTTGRLLLGEEQLVLAASEDEQLTVPLSAVFDVRTGSVPKVFDPLPGTPVTVAFERKGSNEVALVASDEATIGKFTTVLFKAILNGTQATVKHPAKLGGRVLDTEFRDSILGVGSDAIEFQTREGTVTVEPAAVIDFNRERRTVDGWERPAVAVDHMQAGEAVTTVAATDSTRRLSILGRYLRREYDKQMAALQEISLSRLETALLTTIYSTGDHGVSMSGVLGIDADRVRKLLQGLREKGLVEPGENAPVLTSRGQVVVTQYLERVND